MFQRIRAAIAAFQPPPPEPPPFDPLTSGLRDYLETLRLFHYYPKSTHDKVPIDCCGAFPCQIVAALDRLAPKPKEPR